MKIAKVYINQTNFSMDRPFDYLIDREMESLIAVGQRVMVPFGYGNKPLDGVVVDIIDFNAGESNGYKLKKVLGVVENYPVMSCEQLKACEWLQSNYHAFFMDNVNAYFPGTLNIKTKKDSDLKTRFYLDFKIKETIQYSLACEYRDLSLDQVLELTPKNAIKQAEILKYLYTGPKTREELKEVIINPNQAIKSLLTKGILLEAANKESYVHPKKLIKKPDLTPDQKNILSEFSNSVDRVSLLHGVTGSGKTEIYLNMMEEALEQGGTCLYLVPEISLTPQTINRITERFDQKAAVIHSRISDKDKVRQYLEIDKKEIKIIIGARSAVFSPFRDLGLIIIDEEHENTYKSQNRPRYDTIPLACKLAEFFNAKVVLGSATPSMVSYYKASIGAYRLLELPNRINCMEMPRTEIVDMREEIKDGNRSFLSKALYSRIKDRLDKGEQTILFLNKRGYYSFVFCRSCGYVIKCKKCDVAMTYHGKTNKMICHYCNHTRSVEDTCPECKSNKIKYSGSGTERVQALLEKYFPAARVLRMDTDTMKKKDSVQKTLELFADKKADILLGTQMVTKGFDFENVTLVGVLLADLTLNFPDYRSSERTFQLLTQVAGRAGRGTKRGEVVIQTYDPGNYVINHAKCHDYKGFYDKEISFRKTHEYPPFSRLFYVGFAGDDMKSVKKDCESYHRQIKVELEKRNQNILIKDVYPPSPSGIIRINNRYRYYILIKTSRIKEFNDIIRAVNFSDETKKIKSTMIVDVNPNAVF
ncbi:replication restart helicase PriA [Alkalibacter saccharofermentans]|uniref:Replication restart protein PriA n=1 Tax=Alkalibacter saccharofermentans DSM 14828 TaxID=1120975 RepID=A0A1M4S4Y0_9FIRM|nr:primosomal protein N' [Alkalibacter saccharofermentans]SHE27255.1 replication restart DNA helicase PriA [Alkalibacter saccharofermentans DSM 14828]